MYLISSHLLIKIPKHHFNKCLQQLQCSISWQLDKTPTSYKRWMSCHLNFRASICLLRNIFSLCIILAFSVAFSKKKALFKIMKWLYIFYHKLKYKLKYKFILLLTNNLLTYSILFHRWHLSSIKFFLELFQGKVYAAIWLALLNNFFCCFLNFQLKSYMSVKQFFLNHLLHHLVH